MVVFLRGVNYDLMGFDKETGEAKYRNALPRHSILDKWSFLHVYAPIGDNELLGDEEVQELNFIIRPKIPPNLDVYIYPFVHRTEIRVLNDILEEAFRDVERSNYDAVDENGVVKHLGPYRYPMLGNARTPMQIAAERRMFP